MKAADGITDIYGHLYKPFDFDPDQKYPVIEVIYGIGQLLARTSCVDGRIIPSPHQRV